MKPKPEMTPEPKPSADTVKVLTAADLHLKRRLYSDLAKAVAKHRPSVVCLAGDFLDVEALPPTNDRLTPTGAALALAALPCEVAFIRGNHEDFENWLEFEAAWRTTGRTLHAPHHSAVQVGQLVIVGFPCGLGNETAFADGREPVSREPEVWMSRLLRETGPAGRALWVMHEPPSTELAAAEACDPDWFNLIELYQPLLTVSGHDHSTPLRTGRWRTKIGDTVAVNAGQRVTPGEPAADPLIYCVAEFSFVNGRPRLAAVKRHGA